MTLEEQQSLKEQLMRGEVSWETALEAITATSTKPWQTKEWTNKRNALIKNQCEQCGSEQAPMVLQHLCSPRKFADIRHIVREHLWEQYQLQHPITVEEPVPGDRNVCPRCKSTNIKQLKTGDLRWKCYFHSRGRKCGHEFPTPIMVKALTVEQKQKRYAAWKAKSYVVYQEFDAKYGNYIATQAVLLSIDEHARYLSMENTVTFCKKCAFLWDMKGMRLCLKCRVNYHSIGCESCTSCDIEHYKTCEICGIHRHSVSYPACYHCHLATLTHLATSGETADPS